MECCCSVGKWGWAIQGQRTRPAGIGPVGPCVTLPYCGAPASAGGPCPFLCTNHHHRRQFPMSLCWFVFGKSIGVACRQAVACGLHCAEQSSVRRECCRHLCSFYPKQSLVAVLQGGNVWEKAGVNVSVVYGTMPASAYRAAVGRNVPIQEVRSEQGVVRGICTHRLPSL